MIWKNGRFHLNRTATVLTFLIFALFSAFFLSSSASAINLTTAEYSNWYTSDQFNSPTSISQSGIRNTPYSLTDIVDLSTCGQSPNYCYKNYPYNWFWSTPQGINRIQIQYKNVTFLDNSATLHFELNYVISQPFASNTNFPDEWYTAGLDELTILYSNKTRNYSNLSYTVTPWQTSLQSGTNRRTFFNQTITLYGDVSFINLSTNSTEDIIFELGLPNGYPFILSESDVYNNTYRFATFIEQNPTTIMFYTSPNEALQQAQISAINVTNQLLQKQYDQEQQDRMSVQNVSDNANQDGSDASTNAENATSSLLGAITNIYNQLLHPTTSNCIIEGVQIYDMNLGNLDFCTGFTIPQPVFAIGALIMIGLIILLAWSILKAGMSLYNELLGGKT